MKKTLVIVAVFLMLWVAVLPGSAWARGGHHGFHGGWWWPGAVIGGLAVGAVAVATAPFWALSAAGAYAPPVTYAPPVAYAPPATYAAPPAYYAPPTSYAPQAYAPSTAYAAAPAAAVQREVIYPNGRYVLYGDGVRQAWQWVWMPTPSAVPPPPPPPQ